MKLCESQFSRGVTIRREADLLEDLSLMRYFKKSKARPRRQKGPAQGSFSTLSSHARALSADAAFLLLVSVSLSLNP